MQENIRSVKNKRKRYYISKGFQASFIAKFCLLIICASILSGALIYYFNQKTTTVAFENLKVVVRSTADFILPAMLQILVCVTAIIIMATIAVTLFSSHKLVGPLYRMELEIEKIRRGNLSIPIHIREKDQTKRLADALEQMRITLKEHTVSLKENWNSVKPLLKKLESGMQDEAAKQDLRRNMDNIDNELSRLKV